MPWFVCGDCGDTIKKPKILAHTRSCSASVLTCVDCSRDFDARSVASHTSCVTEHDKYARGATKPGGYAAVGFYGEEKEGGGAAAAPSDGGAATPAGAHHLATRPPWTCALCRVTCTSRDVLVGHAAGAKHVRRARAAEKAAKRAVAGAADDAPADDGPSTAPAAATPPTPQRAGGQAAVGGAAAKVANTKQNIQPRWKKLATAALKAAPKKRLTEAALTAAVLAAAGAADADAGAARAAWAERTAPSMGAAASLIVGARVGTEGYYASVERALQALTADVKRLESRTSARRARTDAAVVVVKFYGAAGFVAAVALAAWAVRQPPGALSPSAHAARVAPLFLEPAAVGVALLAVRAVSAALGARDERALGRARARLAAAVADLKDATRHDRTARLLATYDPDTQARLRRSAAAAAASARKGEGSAARPRPQSDAAAPPRGPAAAAAAAAAGALASAGGALLPALDRLAAGVVGDNPSLTAALADARREADALRGALAATQAAAAGLARDNDALRARLAAQEAAPTADKAKEEAG